MLVIIKGQVVTVLLASCMVSTDPRSRSAYFRTNCISYLCDIWLVKMVHTMDVGLLSFGVDCSNTLRVCGYNLEFYPHGKVPLIRLCYLLLLRQIQVKNGLLAFSVSFISPKLYTIPIFIPALLFSWYQNALRNRLQPGSYRLSSVHHGTIDESCLYYWRRDKDWTSGGYGLRG